MAERRKGARGRKRGLRWDGHWELADRRYISTTVTVAKGIIALFIERSSRICDPDRHARHVASILVGARQALLHLRITFTNVEIAVHGGGGEVDGDNYGLTVSRCEKTNTVVT